MPPSSDKPSLAIVDPKGLRRAWLAGYLKSWAEARGLEVVSVDPADITDAIGGLADCRMVVLSCGAERLDEPGSRRRLAALRTLARDVPLVIISDLDEPDQVLEAMRCGATGFLPTSLGPEFVLQAFSFIVDGGLYFPPSVFRRLSFSLGHPTGNGGGDPEHDEPPPGGDQDEDEAVKGAGVCGDALTARQREVYALLQLGEPNKLIARHLGMAEATVKLHVRKILRKLGATNRTQAALSAYQRKSDADEEEQPLMAYTAGHVN